MDDRISYRLERLFEKMAEACARSGRGVDEVQLVAATKKVPPERITEANESGVLIAGENRVQEAMQKKELCPSAIKWHMIGHLQRNKARHAVGFFDMIHSVDSGRLLREIEGECEKQGVSVPVCLEVNLAGESTKYGFKPEELPSVLDDCCSLLRVEVVGLMTMPPFAEDQEDTRPYFAQLRQLRDSCNDKYGMRIMGLSMGMSHDFEVAIEEGATWIRVGTAIFGRRSWNQKQDQAS